MEAMPALGWLAVGAALFDQLGNRLLLRILGEREFSGLEHGTLITLGQLGDMLRNVAAVAGMITLGIALSEFIRPRPFITTRRRLGLAGFAGVFLPTILLATLLPTRRTTGEVVLFAAGAANVLAALLGACAMQWRGPRLLRLAIGAAVLMSFFAFGSLVVLLVGKATLWSGAYPLGMALRRAGEVAFVLATVTMGLSAWPRRRPRSIQLAMAVVGALVALLPLLLISRFQPQVEPEVFQSVLYGALHFELLLESAPFVYVGAVTFALGLGVAGLAAATKARRQLAGATLLLLASGYAPTTPVTLLMLVLGVVLATRALVAASAQLALDESQRDFEKLSQELDDASVH